MFAQVPNELLLRSKLGKQCIYGSTDTPDIVDRKVGTSAEKNRQALKYRSPRGLAEGLDVPNDWVVLPPFAVIWSHKTIPK